MPPDLQLLRDELRDLLLLILLPRTEAVQRELEQRIKALEAQLEEAA